MNEKVMIGLLAEWVGQTDPCVMGRSPKGHDACLTHEALMPCPTGDLFDRTVELLREIDRQAKE